MKKVRHSTAGGVTVYVKGKNYDVTPDIRDKVIGKMGRLDKYLDRLNAIDVELCSEKTKSAGSQNQVEATTHVAGTTIRVSASHEEMYAAVDLAVDKLYRQLNRQKERMKSHHGSKLAEILPIGVEGETDGSSRVRDEDEEPEPVIHVERIDLVPQFEDEAVEDLEQQDREFYIFLNARSEQINILYRRKDGTLSLIEPRVR